MKVQLPEIEVRGNWKGIVLKRPISYDEACIIADSLGVNIDLLKEDWDDRAREDEEEVLEEMNDFISDISDLIEGGIGWDGFCDIWTSGEGLDDLYPTIFMQMLVKLKELDLI